jgi:hypothetical protein
VEHEAFQDSEFVEMVKHLSLAIDVSGIQAPHTMSVGRFFSSNVITLNCPNYEAKLRKHPLLQGIDVVVKPDRVILEVSERREYQNQEFPRAAHIWCSTLEAKKVRRKLRKAFNLPSSIAKPDSKDDWFIPTVLDPGKPLEQRRLKAARRTWQCQTAYLRKLESLEIPFCQDLDVEIECKVGDTETRHVSLRDVLLCWSQNVHQEHPLFISADTDDSGRVIVTFLRTFQTEVNQTLAYLPLLLIHRLGPQAWGWFDKSAAQEYLGTAVYDSAQQKIDDSAADWDFAPQDRVRGEINIEMEGDLSNITSEVSIPTADDGSAFSSITAATPTTTLQTLQALPSPAPQYTGRQGK